MLRHPDTLAGDIDARGIHRHHDAGEAAADRTEDANIRHETVVQGQDREIVRCEIPQHIHVGLE